MCGYIKRLWQKFFFTPFFCCCFWIRDPGWVKIRILDKHPGSATLFVSSFECYYCVCLKDYNLDKLSGLNMSLACRGDYVVKPQVMPRPHNYTMIKKKKNFFSYIKESWRERLQSHTWLTASSYMTKYLRISSHIRKPFPYRYDCFHLNFLIHVYEENFLLFFIGVPERRESSQRSSLNIWTRISFELWRRYEGVCPRLRLNMELDL